MAIMRSVSRKRKKMELYPNRKCETMEIGKSSLCNCVVNFLLEENYILTAFELLHELLDDGRIDQSIRLQQFFFDPSRFSPNQISRFNSLSLADPQTLLQNKEEAEEKLAITDYELRLAQEDITKLKDELQTKTECNIINDDAMTKSSRDVSVIHDGDGGELQTQQQTSFADLGPLKDTERRDLNCAVKEYLLIAGYRLTAMTFYEEVTDQNLDIWQNTNASISDALRHYYYQYLSSNSEAAEVGLGSTQILRYIRSYPRPVVGLPALSTLQAHRGPSVRGGGISPTFPRDMAVVFIELGQVSPYKPI
ncbi:hypothetical protein TSUD_399280, partial [Trifolium subterraneum]